MLNRIQFTTVGAETGFLPLFVYVERVGEINLRNIDGLGPVKRNLQSTLLTSGFNYKLESNRPEQRNVVFTFELRAFSGRSVAEIRQELYKRFQVGRQVNMFFRGDEMEPEAWRLDAVVESVTPIIFDKETLFQVSFLALRNAFEELNNQVETYPANNSVTYSPFTLVYEGTAPSSFQLDFETGASYANFEVQKGVVGLPDPVEWLLLPSAAGFPSGAHWRLRFDDSAVTVMSRRRSIDPFVFHHRYRRSPRIMQLYPGTNVFYFLGMERRAVTVTYLRRFEGM